MKGRIRDFLFYCKTIDFGKGKLSKMESTFYRRFNKEILTLCRSLPDSAQTGSIIFLMQYSGVNLGDELDFFANYYPPAWSILYWLSRDSTLSFKRLERRDITSAVTAQSMAMFLHSLDDHLTNRQVPVSPLTLLLRSQAWTIMNRASCNLAEGVPAGERTVRRFIDDYYSSIQGSKGLKPLDSYCDLFRRQMAIWMIAPILLSMKMTGISNFSRDMEIAYGSFGIAWRLLDDIKDIGDDIEKGSHSSIYHCLPEKIRTRWNHHTARNQAGAKDSTSAILNHILEHSLIDKIKKRICAELGTAASIVEAHNIRGLAREFRCLAYPPETGAAPGEKAMGSRASLRRQCDSLSVEVTTHCNSSCSHCFVRARGPQKSSLAAGLVETMVREAYEAGCRHLHITGGEPLLWEGLLGIFDYAFALGYQTAFLNTNGTLLTGKVSRKLAAYSGLAVSVSLQGPRRRHDFIRGRGSYDRALKGIDNAMSAGLPVHIFTTVGRSLIPDLPRFTEGLFIALPDIKQLTFIQLIRVPADVFDLSKEVLSPDDFLRLVRMVSLLNLYGLKVNLLNNPLATVTSKVLKMPWVPPSHPLYQPGSIMITADLRITLAHSATDDFGIYKPGILPRIIRSDHYCCAVSQDQSICSHCLYARLCRKEGMLRPSEWYRDMFPQVPYCSRVLAKASSYG